MKPDANKYNPDPAYLRELLEKAGVGQQEAARLLRIDGRTFRYYFADPSMSKHIDAPYVVQFALECMAVNE